MPQFDINFYYSQIFWLIVVFSCLYILVSKLIIPMAAKSLNNRQASIESNIASAQQLAAKASLLQQQYASEIQQIQNLVDNIQTKLLTKMHESAGLKQTQLTHYLKAQIIQNNQELQENYQLFWTAENQSGVNLAGLLIKKFTGQPANLELLNKLYKKII